ncbi:hypothetical protein SprV_0602073100 [Sparganum proliferum]
MDVQTASSAAAFALTQGEQTEESRQHPGTLYPKHETERIAGELGMGIVHRLTATIRNKIMQINDRIDVGEQSDVVYQIPCRDCPRHYTGQTERQLSPRITQHKRAVRRGDPLSQVANHTLEEGHEVNLGSTRIEARASNKTWRELLETWASDTNSINRRVDIPPAVTRSVPVVKKRDPISSQGCTQSRRRETAWIQPFREHHPLHSYPPLLCLTTKLLI